MTTVSPDGRKLLRLEVRNSETPIEKKPSWIKTKAKMGPEYTALRQLVKDEGLHTVCQEAGCPNIFECWEDREATFLIGGEQCTRRCDFCQIDTGKPADLDRDEPRRVAESVASMGLRYATITGVARDIVNASAFGAGASLDAFYVAFRIPNLLRRLFAEGAFSQAFVPLLANSRIAVLAALRRVSWRTRLRPDAMRTVFFLAFAAVAMCV